MSGDTEHVLATFPRGERGEIRLARCSFKGAVFTKLQLWFPGNDGELHPGRQVVTIRDHELAEVISALQRVSEKLGVRRPRQSRRAEVQAPSSTDEELREIDEAF